MRPLGMVKRLSVSKPDLEAMTMLTMMAMAMVTEISSLGNVDPPVLQLHGSVLEATRVGGETTVLKTAVQLHLGPLEVVAEMATDMVNRITVLLLLAPLEVQLRGTNTAHLHLPHPVIFRATVDIQAIQAMAILLVVILLNQVWVLHQDLVVALAGLVLLPDLVLSSRLTMEMERRPAHLHLPHLEMHPRLRLVQILL